MTYLPQLIKELDNGGHEFEVLTKTKAQLVRKIEDMMLLDYMNLMKSDGVKLLKQDKIDFMEEWRKDNQDMLSKAGLANGQGEGTKFVSGSFFLSRSCQRVGATPSVCLSS